MERNFLQISRNFSFSRALLSSLSEPLKVTVNAHSGGIALWRKLFFFGAMPAVILSLLNAALSEEPPPPTFVKYPHLRIRNKSFPWRDGVKTLFHNPHKNALPDGYEKELHE